ncbi:MAG: hypothetical protein GC180_12970 [Bacteroidetes bacterium]|nr:hypothetical protein [Bacteroidota bacterium]
MKVEGAKAKGLQALKDLGTRVPDFVEWVIPGLEGFTDESIVKMLDDSPLPEFPLIVRSNLAMEDGDKHSFAGIFDSSGPVKNKGEFLPALKKVFESYHSERAKAYLRENLLPVPERFPVLIQHYIEADYSGVVFSTFPEYPDEVAIHVVKGDNSELLSGSAQGKEYYFNKRSGEWISKNTETLSFLNALKDEVIRLEDEKKKPLDIEFGVKEGQTYFYQMRTVTQPIPRRVVLDNSNIQESYAGICLPLTFSFAKHAYATVYRQTMRLMRLKERQIEAYEDVLNHLLYSYKGRIYYHIENWYRGLLLLPAFRRNKEDMETMMGVQEPVDFVEEDKRNTFQRLIKLPVLIQTMIRLLRAFRTIDRDAGQFRQHFRDEFLSFWKCDLEQFSQEELQQQWNHLDNEILQKWETPIINDFLVMMLNGRMKRKWKGEAGEERLQRLLAQDMQIESMKPLLFYQELAREVRQIPDLLRQFQIDLPTHKWMAESYPAIAKKVEAFISEYGDRVVGELKLETKTLRQNPDGVYHILRNFVEDDLSDLTAKETGLVETRDRSFHRLKNAIERREALRMDRTRLFGMYRRLFLEYGSRLNTAGMLESERDIFYLTREELSREDLWTQNWKPLIDDRKAEFASYKDLNLPGHIVLPQRLSTSSVVMEGELKGEGIIGKRIEGEVLVYQMEELVPNLKGKILVAPRTDPGWVPLFPGCKAVLIEKGSSLSHSVVVLREMGIPCMINIPGLCKCLKSGMVVDIDIPNGRIKIKS